MVALDREATDSENCSKSLKSAIKRPSGTFPLIYYAKSIVFRTICCNVTVMLRSHLMGLSDAPIGPKLVIASHILCVNGTQIQLFRTCLLHRLGL